MLLMVISFCILYITVAKNKTFLSPSWLARYSPTRASRQGIIIGRVSLLFGLFPLYLLDHLTFDLAF